jgi:hypothetical protein
VPSFEEDSPPDTMAINRDPLGLQLPVSGPAYAETIPFEVFPDSDFRGHLRRHVTANDHTDAVNQCSDVTVPEEPGEIDERLNAILEEND